MALQLGRPTEWFEGISPVSSVQIKAQLKYTPAVLGSEQHDDSVRQEIHTTR